MDLKKAIDTAKFYKRTKKQLLEDAIIEDVGIANSYMPESDGHKKFMHYANEKIDELEGMDSEN